MSRDETTRAEEEAVEAALSELGLARSLSDGGEHLAAVDGEVALLERLNRETLGLLAYGVEAVRPAPTLKARILEAAGATRRASEARPAATVATLAGERARRALRDAPGLPSPPSSPSWPFRIAATVALLALGLSAWLFWQLEGKARDQREMRALLAQLGERARSAETRAVEADRLQETLLLLTSRGVSVCELEPPTPGTARGVMYVASDHQHWYLRLEGLEAPPDGHEYRVWFLVDGQPRSAGRVLASPDRTAEIGSDTMPAGTSAVLVSLETAGQPLAAPTGPRILFGDRMLEIS